MAECFLFFRCWPGFNDSFPVDRFNALTDEELTAALESFAKGELGRSEIREQVKQVAKRRRQKLIAALRRQAHRVTGGGGSVPGSGRRIPKREWYWPQIRRADRTDPLVCRLGAYLGWWSNCGRDKFCAFGPRVWFLRVTCRESAERIVSALEFAQGRL